MVMTKEKSKCPKLYLSWFDQKTKLCQLSNKECLLESGAYCDYYQEWIAENTLSLSEDDGQI